MLNEFAVKFRKVSEESLGWDKNATSDLPWTMFSQVFVNSYNERIQSIYS